jgi:hypothetical protein
MVLTGSCVLAPVRPAFVSPSLASSKRKLIEAGQADQCTDFTKNGSRLFFVRRLDKSDQFLICEN